MGVMASPRGFVVRLASRSTLITRPPHIIPTLYDTFQRRENKHFSRLVPRAPLERCLVVERGGTTHLRSVQLRCSELRVRRVCFVSVHLRPKACLFPQHFYKVRVRGRTSYPLTYVPLTRTTIRPPRTCSLTRVGDTMPLETLEAQKSSCSEPTPVVCGVPHHQPAGLQHGRAQLTNEPFGCCR